MGSSQDAKTEGFGEEKMVAGGISVIWNFAPCTLSLPEHVLVKNQDLAVELATLSHHIARRRLKQSHAEAITAAVNHSDPVQS